MRMIQNRAGNGPKVMGSGLEPAAGHRYQFRRETPVSSLARIATRRRAAMIVLAERVKVSFRPSSCKLCLCKWFIVTGPSGCLPISVLRVLPALKRRTLCRNGRTSGRSFALCPRLVGAIPAAEPDHRRFNKIQARQDCDDRHILSPDNKYGWKPHDAPVSIREADTG